MLKAAFERRGLVLCKASAVEKILAEEGYEIRRINPFMYANDHEGEYICPTCGGRADISEKVAQAPLLSGCEWPLVEHNIKNAPELHEQLRRLRHP